MLLTTVPSLHSGLDSLSLSPMDYNSESNSVHPKFHCWSMASSSWWQPVFRCLQISVLEYCIVGVTEGAFSEWLLALSNILPGFLDVFLSPSCSKCDGYYCQRDRTWETSLRWGRILTYCDDTAARAETLHWIERKSELNTSICYFSDSGMRTQCDWPSPAAALTSSPRQAGPKNCEPP